MHTSNPKTKDNINVAKKVKRSISRRKKKKKKMFPYVILKKICNIMLNNLYV